MVASQSDIPSFLVVLSAPGITPAEQNMFTVENQIRDAGFSEEEVAEATSLQRRVYDYFRVGGNLAELQSDIDDARMQPWFIHTFLPTELPDGPIDMSGLDFDVLPIWETIPHPVLGL